MIRRELKFCLKALNIQLKWKRIDTLIEEVVKKKILGFWLPKFIVILKRLINFLIKIGMGLGNQHSSEDTCS